MSKLKLYYKNSSPIDIIDGSGNKKIKTQNKYFEDDLLIKEEDISGSLDASAYQDFEISIKDGNGNLLATITNGEFALENSIQNNPLENLNTISTSNVKIKYGDSEEYTFNTNSDIKIHTSQKMCDSDFIITYAMGNPTIDLSNLPSDYTVTLNKLSATITNDYVLTIPEIITNIPARSGSGINSTPFPGSGDSPAYNVINKIIFPENMKLKTLGARCFDYLAALNICIEDIEKYASSINFKSMGSNPFHEAISFSGETVRSTLIDNDGIKVSEISIGNIESIQNYAFGGCGSVETIRLMNGVTTIGSGSFSYMSELRHIYLPITISSIGSHCFYRNQEYNDTGGLFNIYYPGNIEQWDAINKTSDSLLTVSANLYLGNQTADYKYYNKIVL